MSAALEIFALCFQGLERSFRLKAVPGESGFLTTLCGRDASRTPGRQGPGQQGFHFGYVCIPVIGANGQGGALKIVTVVNTQAHAHTHQQGERDALPQRSVWDRLANT